MHQSAPRHSNSPSTGGGPRTPSRALYANVPSRVMQHPLITGAYRTHSPATSAGPSTPKSQTPRARSPAPSPKSTRPSSPARTMSPAKTPRRALATAPPPPSPPLDDRALMAMSCLRAEITLRRFDANKILEVKTEREKQEGLLQDVCRRLTREGHCAMAEQQGMLRDLLSQMASVCGLGASELQQITSFTDAHRELLTRVMERPGGVTTRNLSITSMADLDAALRDVAIGLADVLASFGDLPKVGELKEVLSAVMLGMRDLAFSVSEGAELADSRALSRRNSIQAQEATECIGRLYNAPADAVPQCPFPLCFSVSSRGPHVTVSVRESWLRVEQ